MCGSHMSAGRLFSTAVYFLMLSSCLSRPPLCEGKKNTSFTGENRHAESPLTGIFSRRRMLNHLDICVFRSYSGKRLIVFVPVIFFSPLSEATEAVYNYKENAA